MFWLNFIFGLNFILFCFKIIIIHSHNQKQTKIKFNPMKKLNHNIYIILISLEKGEILIFHTFRMIGSSVVVTLWNILLTPANGTSFLVVTRS